MKGDTLLWAALLGFGGYFLWTKLGSPTASVNLLTSVPGVGEYTPTPVPPITPGFGMQWSWDGMKWAQVPVGGSAQ